MSTSPLPGPDPRSGCPHGPAHLLVADMGRSLGFYLGLGCEVCRAADGWALLHSAGTCFVLVHAGAPGSGWRTRSRPDRPTADPAPRLRLRTPQLRALRRRLLVEGICATAIIRPVCAPAGEITIADPDQHLVVLEQLTARRALPRVTPRAAGTEVSPIC